VLWIDLARMTTADLRVTRTMTTQGGECKVRTIDLESRAITSLVSTLVCSSILKTLLVFGLRLKS
jgi:hypothetical protein